jgi:polysaccharide pyruvyl transferase WcaK-like protein
MANLVRNGRSVRCLLVGYNGVGNTGSDVRLLTAISDVREAFGEKTRISVMTIDADRTAAILPRNIEIEIIEVCFSPIRLTIGLWNLARRHDVILLVEGSTFKQNWSVWLLHAYLWAANSARWNGNYAIAYAVDVGELSGFHALRTRHECERLAMVITRTEIARDRLVKLGVRRPVLANTDTAFRFVCAPERRTEGRRVLGLAPIEFFHWPVRFRPWCRPEDKYRGPFAFTWNAERRTQSEAMLQSWVNLTRHAIERHDLDIQLIAMEDLDIPVCERIIAELGPSAADRVSLSFSRQVAPLKMTAILRGLDALVTSRYHACVLSMGGAVPQMAICHDERLASIYAEVGIEKEFLLQYMQPDLANELIRTFDRMMKDVADLSDRIRDTHAQRFLPLCAQNRIDLEAWGQRTFQSISTDSSEPQSATERAG